MILFGIAFSDLLLPFLEGEYKKYTFLHLDNPRIHLLLSYRYFLLRGLWIPSWIYSSNEMCFQNSFQNVPSLGWFRVHRDRLPTLNLSCILSEYYIQNCFSGNDSRVILLVWDFQHSLVVLFVLQWWKVLLWY